MPEGAVTNNNMGDARQRSELESNHDEDIQQPYYNLASTVSPNDLLRNELRSSSQIVRNFVWLGVLFSVNHSCTLSCMSLATARLGAVGAWQGGIFFLSYTASSLIGATYVVKRLGSWEALRVGMWIYTFYVVCFVVMEVYPILITAGVVVGAMSGGIGRGMLVMAQGSYFGSVAADYAAKTSKPLEDATSYLGGVFAAIFLALEVLVRLAPTFLIFYVNLSWEGLFILYAALSGVSAIAMRGVHQYPSTTANERIRSPRQSAPEMVPPNRNTWDKASRLITSEPATVEQGGTSLPEENAPSQDSVWRKATATIRLLYEDPKMKYLIWSSASFGFGAAFINSFVNGTMIAARTDGEPVYAIVGFLMAVAAAMAALSSIFFGRAAQWWGKGPILIFGGVAFFFMAFPFVIEPDVSSWTWRGLAVIYALLGIGRSTFEGTLRATFADYFPHEKEGAFGNIVLQQGVSGAVGYFLSVHVHCRKESTSSPFCVEFIDGSWHNVLPLEFAVMASGVLSILGYWRASYLRNLELETIEEKEMYEMGERVGTAALEVSPRRPNP